MTLAVLKTEFTQKLSSLYPAEEISSFFYLLIQHQIGLDKTALALQPATPITASDEGFFYMALERLKKQEPIQYIIGSTEFYGLCFKVNEHVLIPRPETEELVDWILKSGVKNSNNSLQVLDIGTGSGCIAISLATHLPKATIYALDISEKGLELAKENAINNKVKIAFIKRDILEKVGSEIWSATFQPMDLIVSNPPYVRDLEKAGMQANVLENEPSLALFVPDKDPLIYYKKIADFAVSNLAKNGMLFFEINQALATETLALLRQKGFTELILRKDLFGNDRMISAKF